MYITLKGKLDIYIHSLKNILREVEIESGFKHGEREKKRRLEIRASG